MMEMIVSLAIIMIVCGIIATVVIISKMKEGKIIVVVIALFVAILGVYILYSVPPAIVENIDIITQLDDRQPYYAYESITPNNRPDSKILLVQKINPITGEFFGPISAYYVSKERLPLPYHCIYAPTKIISKNGRIEIWNPPF